MTKEEKAAAKAAKDAEKAAAKAAKDAEKAAAKADEPEVVDSPVAEVEEVEEKATKVIANGQFQAVREGKGFRVYGKLGEKVSPVMTELDAIELARRFNNPK